MKQSIASIVESVTGASQVQGAGVLQSLWSGYGSIVRYHLAGCELPSVVVKHVSPPSMGDHPRGWNTTRSHERKLKSYSVETAWYRDYANRCGDACRVPHCLGVVSEGDEVVIVLEDLDAAGYPLRKQGVRASELEACLSWLAHFHATFLNVEPDGLWERGTYWHLETRPDELEVLEREDRDLFAAAGAIDAKLKSSAFQTLVHGDAKLANFCFAEIGASVAAVDFQYVGKGCAMQDLAYFIGSCLSEDACAEQAEDLLDVYFDFLGAALNALEQDVDVEALEAEWRGLYPVAWTDFHRFLKGWCPGHWKIHGYSEQLAREVVAELGGASGCS